MGTLPELIEYHNNAVRELEGVLTRYLKGGRIGKSRPFITIGGFWGIGGEKKVLITSTSPVTFIDKLTRFRMQSIIIRKSLPTPSIYISGH